MARRTARRKEVKENKKPRKSRLILVSGTYFDYPLLFLIVFLAGMGLLMVYSASYYASTIKYNDSSFFFMKQLKISLAGLAVMLVVSCIKYQIYNTKLIYLGLLLGGVLMVLLKLKGKEVNGSQRWLIIGGVSIQPSEIIKIVLILFVAYLLTQYSGELNTLWGSAKILFIPLIFVVLIAIENLSSAIICFAIIMVMFFVATPKPFMVIGLGLFGLALLVGSVFMVGYRSSRIDAWLHPETADKGYQVMQSLYAVGSGGLFGRGLGQSIQKMGFVPEAYNDMIFSIICEELGVIGAAGIIIVFIMLLWRLKFIVEGAPDRFGAFIVVGVIAHIAVQVIVNIGVVTNTIPNTGVTLPFISYGGTSLLLLLAEMGIVLAVSKQIRPAKNIDEETGLQNG